MTRWLRIVVLPALALALLAGCGGSGVRERVFPPTVSVQEVVRGPGDGWTLKLRLQNFSNVAMQFDRIEASLQVGGAAAGTVALQPMISVPPESAEIVELPFAPSQPAASQLQGALDRRGNVRYVLEGTVRSTEPQSRRDEFKFESQLTAVPGLAGVLR